MNHKHKAVYPLVFVGVFAASAVAGYYSYDYIDVHVKRKLIEKQGLSIKDAVSDVIQGQKDMESQFKLVDSCFNEQHMPSSKKVECINSVYKKLDNPVALTLMNSNIVQDQDDGKFTSKQLKEIRHQVVEAYARFVHHDNERMSKAITIDKVLYIASMNTVEASWLVVTGGTPEYSKGYQTLLETTFEDAVNKSTAHILGRKP